MFMVNQLSGFGAGGVHRASIALGDNVVDGSNKTTYTFADASLGTSASDRQVVVGVINHDASSPQDVTALTIDGVAAGRVTSLVNGEVGLDFWAADVPSNATGDIVVTLGREANRCGIGVWAVYAAQTAPFDVARNTDDPMAAALDVPIGGVGIGIAGHNSNGTFDWTNMAKRYDEIVETGSATVHTGADATSDGTLTRTCDPSASSPPRSGNAARLVGAGQPGDGTPRR